MFLLPARGKSSVDERANRNSGSHVRHVRNENTFSGKNFPMMNNLVSYLSHSKRYTSYQRIMSTLF